MENETMGGYNPDISEIGHGDSSVSPQFLGSDEDDGSYMPSFGNDGLSAIGDTAQSRYDVEADLGDDQFDTDGWSYINIGKLAYQQKDFAAAQASLEQGLSQFLRMNDGAGISTANYYLGKAIYRQGSYSDSREYFQQSFEHCEDGNKNCLASTLWYLGKVAYREGAFDEATWNFTRALQYARELDDQNRIAWAMNYLGKVGYRLKDYSTARANFKEALPLFQELNDKDAVATCMLNLAQVELALGRFAEAHLWAADSSKLYDELGDTSGVEDCARVIENSERVIETNLHSPRGEWTQTAPSPQLESQPFLSSFDDLPELDPKFDEISNPELFGHEASGLDFTNPAHSVRYEERRRSSPI